MNGSVNKRTYTRAGKTWTRFVATVDDSSTGERVRESKSFALERDAKAWRDAKLAKGRLEAGREVTVAALLERWFEHITAAGREPRTLRNYRLNIDHHLIPKLGPLRLSVLAPLHVQRLVDELATSLAPQTVANIVAPLRAALNQARRWRLVSENVAELAELPRRDVAEVAPLTVEEARKFIEAAKSHRLGAILTVTVTLGLRQSEAVALTWADVDFEARTLTVRQKAYRVNDGYYVGRPKSQRSTRTIPLPSALIPVLREQRISILKEQLAGEWTDRNLVFPNRHGDYLYGSYVTRQMQGILKKAGLPVKRYHDLRHTAASAMFAMGADVKEIQEVLGHSDVRLTAQLYTHAGSETRARTAARMDAWLGS